MWGTAKRIRQHLADPQSQHRKIAQGFLWVSLFVFLGKLAGAAKEMTIAWRYGVGKTVDAYVFVFNLVSWPVSIWFSVLTVVLLPLAAGLRSDNPSELPRFRAELLGLTLLLGLGLGLLVWLALPALLRSSWLNFSDRALTEALSMTAGLALLVPLGFVVSLFSAWLLAAGRHRNTLFEAIPAFILMMFLLLPPGLVPEPLIWGTVAGFALHMSALAIPVHRYGELRTPVFTQKSPAWRGFWGGISIMAAGQVLMSASSLIDQFFAAALEPGALSVLSYANRILTLILGLGATAVGRATLPVFSEAQIRGAAYADRLAMHWAALMFGLGVVGLFVGWIVAPWSVSLLFERGAFTASDTQRVSEIFQISLFQLPFYFSAMVLVTALATQKKYVWITLTAAVNLIIKLVFMYFLVDVYGLKGLVVSTTFMYAASTLTLLIVLKKTQPHQGAS